MKRAEFLRLIEDNGGPAGLYLSNVTLEADSSQQNGMDLSPRALEDLRTPGLHKPPNRDLPGIDLAGIKLPGVQARNLRAKRANLAGAQLADSDFSGADLDEAILSGCVLTKSTLSDATLREADLTDAQLDGAILARVQLARARLVRTCLRGADLQYSTLESAMAIEADMSDSDLSNARLGEAVLEQVKLKNARFNDADFQRATLSSVDLKDATLKYANLGGARLRGCTLDSADLSGSNLAGATFEGSSLRKVTLGGASISADTGLAGAIWDNYVLGDELKGAFSEAEGVYRVLKLWYEGHGDRGTAGEFAYRENITARKALPPERKRWRVWLWTLDQLFGHGERPLRLIRPGSHRSSSSPCQSGRLVALSRVAFGTPFTSVPCRSQRSATVAGSRTPMLLRGSWALRRHSGASSCLRSL